MTAEMIVLSSLFMTKGCSSDCEKEGDPFSEPDGAHASVD